MVHDFNLNIILKIPEPGQRCLNFCVDINNFGRLISISNVGTFKFEDQCLIPK